MQLKLQVLLVLLMFRHAVNFYYESYERLLTLKLTLKSQGWSEHAKTRKNSAEYLRVVDCSLVVAEG